MIESEGGGHGKDQESMMIERGRGRAMVGKHQSMVVWQQSVVVGKFACGTRGRRRRRPVLQVGGLRHPGQRWRGRMHPGQHGGGGCVQPFEL
jgi:hypothetical protein